jgi:hypothetical protein
MIITVTDKEEIEVCQKKLCRILEAGLSLKKECLLGVPGSSKRYNVFYNDKIWWYYQFCPAKPEEVLIV